MLSFILNVLINWVLMKKSNVYSPQNFMLLQILLTKDTTSSSTLLRTKRNTQFTGIFAVFLALIFRKTPLHSLHSLFIGILVIRITRLKIEKLQEFFKNHAQPQLLDEISFCWEVRNFCFSFLFNVCEEVVLQEKTLF